MCSHIRLQQPLLTTQLTGVKWIAWPRLVRFLTASCSHADPAGWFSSTKNINLSWCRTSELALLLYIINDKLITVSSMGILQIRQVVFVWLTEAGAKTIIRLSAFHSPTNFPTLIGAGAVKITFHPRLLLHPLHLVIVALFFHLLSAIRVTLSQKYK